MTEHVIIQTNLIIISINCLCPWEIYIYLLIIDVEYLS